MSAALINAVTTKEFMKYQGDLIFTGATREADWYIALFKGTTAPTDSLTAATLWDTYEEVVKYDGDRPKWLAKPSETVAGVYGIAPPTNPKDPTPEGVETITFTTLGANESVIINGGCLISRATKGSKEGVLAAVWIYPSEFVKNASETFVPYATFALTNGMALVI
jgi:hypothetical protein